MGCCVFMDDKIVSWKSKDKSVSKSSAELEYYDSSYNLWVDLVKTSTSQA